jgi:hypothetical protein
MSKQTAVEWLEQEFNALQNYGVNELGLFAKAKQMEEQQRSEDLQLGYDACEFHNDYENLQTKPINNPYKKS